MSDEKETRSVWKPVKKLMADSHKVILGSHLSYHAIHTPRRLLYMMSYYKFAAKMIGKNKRVLDIGCGEGLGTWLLAVECGYTRGIDLDLDAIEIGSANWQDPRITFECSDFLKMRGELFDAVVGFDIIEHVTPDHIGQFWNSITRNIKENGIVIIGTPNINSNQYASSITQVGHVNMYSAERLRSEMQEYFSNIFLFSANDEVVHTGFAEMAHYFIAIGSGKLL